MKQRDLPLGLVDNKTEKCFYFRRNRNGSRNPRYFSYRRGRSYDAVRAEAIAYALAMNEKFGPPPVTSVKGRMTRKNTSGVVGVSLADDVVKGHVYYNWIARWPGNRSGVRFAVSIWGEDKGFVLACLARELESKDKELLEKVYFECQQKGELDAILRKKRLNVSEQMA